MAINKKVAAIACLGAALVVMAFLIKGPPSTRIIVEHKFPDAIEQIPGQMTCSKDNKVIYIGAPADNPFKPTEYDICLTNPGEYQFPK